MNVNWREWAAEHPVRARRLLANLTTAMETCPDMPTSHADQLRAKCHEIRMGLGDYATAILADRRFRDATEVRT